MTTTTPDQVSNQNIISNIRHELRTPINAIIGYSEMLIEDLAEEESEVKEDLEKILVGGREILSVITKILEQYNLNSEDFYGSIVKLFENIENEVSPSLRKVTDNSEKLLTKIKDDDLISDVTRIQKAGNNLKTLLQNKIDCAEIYIPHNLPKNSHQHIVYKKPDIVIESSALAENNYLSEEIHFGHILVVDDNENNRDLLLRQLQKQGYTVAQAYDGRMALEMIDKGNYDLILLDLLMPELNGYEVLERLKSNTKWQHIPVIMISALNEFDSIINCIEIGAEDFLPKPFNPTLLKARIGASLEKKRLRDLERKYLQKVEEYSQKLDRELEIGRTMQLNFLPPKLLEIENWAFASFFKPARQVAGDFYDLFPLPNGNIALVIADVCDKGVGAALFMALFRSLIRIFSCDDKIVDNLETLFSASKAPSTGWMGDHQTNLAHFKALRSVGLTNNYVAENHGDLGMFATLFLGILEPETGLITYINGGHEPLFIINSNREIIQLLNSTGPAVGMIPDINFVIEQVYLKHGDVLFGYTDGVPEARSSDRTFFTEQRLEQLIPECNPSAIEITNYVAKQLSEHIGNADQFDDITMLAIQRLT